MEDLLLQNSEYILLRGKGDGNWPGLLREVSIVPARRIDGQAVIDLHSSVPAEYQENAVFMMNVVTLHELCLAPGVRNLLTHEEDGGFRLLDKPIVLCDSCPAQRRAAFRSSTATSAEYALRTVGATNCGRNAATQAQMTRAAP